MKKLTLCFLFIASPLFADEGLPPQQVVENYFEFFNNEDRASLNSSSGEPFVFIIGLYIAEDQTGEMWMGNLASLLFLIAIMRLAYHPMWKKDKSED